MAEKIKAGRSIRRTVIDLDSVNIALNNLFATKTISASTALDISEITSAQLSIFLSFKISLFALYFAVSFDITSGRPLEIIVSRTIKTEKAT